jgi:hypothetical protein
MPQPGDFVIMPDGEGRPRFIRRTTEVTIKPLSQADEAFAWDEGEGDRTREWWLDPHRRYFPREATHEGFEIDDEILTVFEHASRWSGCSMSQTGSTGRLQPRPDEGLSNPLASNIEPRSQSRGLGTRSQRAVPEAFPGGVEAHSAPHLTSLTSAAGISASPGLHQKNPKLLEAVDAPSLPGWATPKRGHFREQVISSIVLISSPLRYISL